MMALTVYQAGLKRVFDIVLSGIGLLITFWIIALSWVIATIDTGVNGFFTQERVGRGGRLFRVIKLRTMRIDREITTTVTTVGDSRITKIGRMFRKSKLDELPQLINVLKGDMSFVGPRPDVPGFADKLEGKYREILTVRPGITGPATLKYRNEEVLLSQVQNPIAYNRDVIYPDKIEINYDYVTNWSFVKDLKYIWLTIIE